VAKPKYKKGDKVRITLELTIRDVDTMRGRDYYLFSRRPMNNSWYPDCNLFDKKAVQIKKPAKKKK
jgi:hypothetical protein